MAEFTSSTYGSGEFGLIPKFGMCYDVEFFFNLHYKGTERREEEGFLFPR